MAVEAWVIGRDAIPEETRGKWRTIKRRRPTFTAPGDTIDTELGANGLEEAMSYMSGYIVVQEDEETPVIMHRNLFDREYQWA